MLKINKGEPWVMWPDKMVANFIEYPANKIFEYDGNYKFILTFELNEDIVSKSTLFCKLPSYLGIDLELNGITFIVTETNMDTMYHIRKSIMVFTALVYNRKFSKSIWKPYVSRSNAH
jgi:hypothetical protein